MADAENPGFDIKVDGGLPVNLPSGAQMRVLTSAEQEYLHSRVERYLHDNHFVNIADLQDVDKMVTYELFLHRWSLWQAMGEDYFGEAVSVKELAIQIEGLSRELRQIKKQLGIDKVARDRQRGDDSIPAFIDKVVFRAGQFGVLRNEQFAQVITSFQRISGIVTYHDKCTEEERVEFACTPDDVLAVLRDEIRKFEAIDEKFRTDIQQMWIREQ